MHLLHCVVILLKVGSIPSINGNYSIYLEGEPFGGGVYWINGQNIIISL